LFFKKAIAKNRHFENFLFLALAFFLRRKLAQIRRTIFF
jgi:hypothetical protein